MGPRAHHFVLSPPNTIGTFGGIHNTIPKFVNKALVTCGKGAVVGAAGGVAVGGPSGAVKGAAGGCVSNVVSKAIKK